LKTLQVQVSFTDKDGKPVRFSCKECGWEDLNPISTFNDESPTKMLTDIVCPNCKKPVFPILLN